MTIPTTTTYSLLKLQWWAEKSIRIYPLSFCLHLLLPRPVADVGFERGVPLSKNVLLSFLFYLSLQCFPFLSSLSPYTYSGTPQTHTPRIKNKMSILQIVYRKQQNKVSILPHFKLYSGNSSWGYNREEIHRIFLLSSPFSPPLFIYLLWFPPRQGELADYIDAQIRESQTKKTFDSLKNKVVGLAVSCDHS